MSGIVRKRSVEIAGHRTSVSIEEPFWEALKEVATREGLSMNELVTKIDSVRDGNLSSAIRVYVLHALRR
jgi:predicted DNA-binding ribbon-helix-helix protein